MTDVPECDDHLIVSSDRQHPANLIPELCRKFWTLGWVTGIASLLYRFAVIFHRINQCFVGTGGGVSIRNNNLVYLAPSGVQKELLEPENIYVLEMSKQIDAKTRTYLRSPPNLRPSQCTPLFMAAYKKRNAACCIHTHSQWAVLVTLLLERRPQSKVFEINNIEQIKAFGRGWKKNGALGYHDTLRVPIIENTPFEEDLTDSLEAAMDEFPDTYAVLVRRHGLYVWGETVDKAKQQAESLDYLFQLAVEMEKLKLPWLSNIMPVA
ncbi:Methylthioribulose-1-phosphate dehydratase [Golovinomyces cichoracearum]|uniref:Methylthioribulose-1-phosphate dehydratase n=1 Tax=Golovinomyces cichoracearum TaxID=62708 RepID=A0A420IW21_9PEZI|nr:Methylthioribulose-1-phosphate dehydratase [Golovinomyces cichoracearum]